MERCSRERLVQFKVRLVDAPSSLGRRRPETSCCSVCSAWDNRTQRNHKGLKIAADLLGGVSYEKQDAHNTQLLSLRYWERNEGHGQITRAAPCPLRSSPVLVGKSVRKTFSAILQLSSYKLHYRYQMVTRDSRVLLG